MVSKAILFLASLPCLTCVRALDMGPRLFTRMEPPVPFYTPFTQPNNIWPLPCGTGFPPTWEDSQHQNPAAAFTAPFSNPWATPFPCNKTSKPGAEAKGVALTQAGPPRSGCSATGRPASRRGNTHRTVLGTVTASQGLTRGPAKRNVGLAGQGEGSRARATPCFMAPHYQHRGRWPCRLFEEQPVIDRQGAGSVSHADRCVIIDVR